MRPIAQWAHLMSSLVTVAPKSGVDGYGKPSYGSAVQYQAHIYYVRQMVRTAGGEEVESQRSVHLATSASVLPTARLTLSTGDAGSTEENALHPLIVSVGRRFDQNGGHHTVLFL